MQARPLGADGGLPLLLGRRRRGLGAALERHRWQGVERGDLGGVERRVGVGGGQRGPRHGWQLPGARAGIGGDGDARHGGRRGCGGRPRRGRPGPLHRRRGRRRDGRGARRWLDALAAAPVGHDEPDGDHGGQDQHRGGKDADAHRDGRARLRGCRLPGESLVRGGGRRDPGGRPARRILRRSAPLGTRDGWGRVGRRWPVQRGSGSRRRGGIIGLVRPVLHR